MAISDKFQRSNYVRDAENSSGARMEEMDSVERLPQIDAKLMFEQKTNEDGENTLRERGAEDTGRFASIEHVRSSNMSNQLQTGRQASQVNDGNILEDMVFGTDEGETSGSAVVNRHSMHYNGGRVSLPSSEVTRGYHQASGSAGEPALFSDQDDDASEIKR